MTDTPLRISQLPVVTQSELDDNLVIPILTFNQTTQNYENKLINLTLLRKGLDVNAFVGREWLEQSDDVVLTNESPSFHYIDPENNLSFTLPNPEGSDYFRFRSLNGEFKITIISHDDEDLIFLGNEVENGDVGRLETRLLGDCHYIDSQWICNVF